MKLGPTSVDDMGRLASGQAQLSSTEASPQPLQLQTVGSRHDTVCTAPARLTQMLGPPAVLDLVLGGQCGGRVTVTSHRQRGLLTCCDKDPCARELPCVPVDTALPTVWSMRPGKLARMHPLGQPPSLQDCRLATQWCGSTTCSGGCARPAHDAKQGAVAQANHFAPSG